MRRKEKVSERRGEMFTCIEVFVLGGVVDPFL